MKKISWLLLLLTTVTFFSYCNTTKKATVATPMATAFYDTDVKGLVEARCTPCHITARGGRKEPLDTYETLKANLDEVIHRIELKPEDRGFMPFKHQKLSEAEIEIFKKWKTGGMAQTR